MFSIPNTRRLRFIVGNVSYDKLFENIFHSNDLYDIMKDEIKQLSGDALKEKTAEYIRLMEADIRFIVDHVAPKEECHKNRICIYAEMHTGEPVGRVIINGSTSEHPTIDIRLLKEYQHQGYGYELLKAITSAIFEQLPIDHLEYDVSRTNESSRKLVQKLGGMLTYSDDAGEMYIIMPEYISGQCDNRGEMPL